jgi:pimeloyl-ACP methyl ester carboxylesterase
MPHVTSSDGTTIAYDQFGEGPPLILVDGALCVRGSKAELAAQLAPHYTVYIYDRRGRGDSGDTQPYAVAREVEDLEALMEQAGGSAALYGHSSGAILALEAALALPTNVTALALYEAPYNDDPGAAAAAAAYVGVLRTALAEGRNGDAVALFMRYIGMPDQMIDGLRQQPFFSSLEAVAPTMAYDHAELLGTNPAVPAARLSKIIAPTLVLHGGASFEFMATSASTVSQAIAGSASRTVEGQTHEVDPAVLAPIIREFLNT